MKARKFAKRLTLNKETIANLSNGEMKSLIGRGESTFATSCTSEYPCNTTWDVCDPTMCATVCNYTEAAYCTFGCPPGGGTEGPDCTIRTE